MLARTSWIRLAAILLSTAVGLTVPGFLSVAHAQDEEKAEKKDDGGGGDEEEEEEEEEEGAEEGGEEGDEDPNKLDKDQPPLTAGANYTLETWSLAEVERPLILSVGILEGRIDVTAGLNKGAAFKEARMGLELKYGMSDTLQLHAGADLGLATPDGAPKSNGINAGVEMSILFDMIDARLSFEYDFSSENFDIVIGFPVKYRFNDKIAIIALDRILSIHTQGGSPDLEVGVGGVFQAMPILAIVVRARLILPQFEPDLLTIPLQVDVQVSPINRVDFGLAAVLGNVKGGPDPDGDGPIEGPGPIDSRAVQLFVRARF
jgi:hypothetical protein